MTELTFPAEVIAGYLRLSTPNVSDALDRLGLLGATHGILPLWPTCRKMAGPAATMKLVAVGETEESPVLGSLRAVAAAPAGSVLVIDHAGRTDVNSFGGVVGFTAFHRGLAGCVVHGVVRDVDDYRAYDFPVYARGVTQLSIRNRCAFGGYGVEVDLGGARARPGDFIMADEHGVIVVPREHAEPVLRIALECKVTEERIVEAIRGGADPVEAHQRAQYERLTSPSDQA